MRSRERERECESRVWMFRARNAIFEFIQRNLIACTVNDSIFFAFALLNRFLKSSTVIVHEPLDHRSGPNCQTMITEISQARFRKSCGNNVRLMSVRLENRGSLRVSKTSIKEAPLAPVSKERKKQEVRVRRLRKGRSPAIISSVLRNAKDREDRKLLRYPSAYLEISTSDNKLGPPPMTRKPSISHLAQVADARGDQSTA